MHARCYGIAVAAVTTALAFVSLSSYQTLLVVALGIAVIGVPHGGLDHWTGRRLLGPQFGTMWGAVFFTSYIIVSLMVAVGWYLLPSATVISFFLISAWHFGREDQGFNRPSATEKSSSQVVWMHLIATSVGGMAIWGVVLFRPTEALFLLEALVPASASDNAAFILSATRAIGLIAMPIALAFSFHQFLRRNRVDVAMATMVTLVATVALPVLVSFALYFCGWHSVRGLIRLKAESGLEWMAFGVRLLPLSIAAVALIYLAHLMLKPLILNSGGLTPKIEVAGIDFDSLLRMTFIGLSALAVPHLFLHEVSELKHRSVQSSPFASGDLMMRSAS